MIESKKLLVLHCPAGGGHRAAARAIAEAAAARGVEAEVLDALESTPRWFAKAYVGAHLRSTEHAPGFYGFGYAALNQRSPLADGVRGAFDRTIGARLVERISRENPLAVVATHFFPLAVLGHARQTGRLQAPLIGVVTDYAAHAFWAEKGVDRFCAAPGRAARDLVRHGVDPGAVIATGIPIRPAFGAIAPIRPLADGDTLEVLVTSGGFGVGPMLDVIRSFASISRVHLTIVCGDNPERVEQARRVAAELRVPAEVVGFEPDMAGRMARCHLVVGKPGGLTVSESLAAGRPMVLVGTCPGQEAMNETWLVEQQAAVASTASRAGAACRDLRPRLAAYASAARDLASPRAADRVVDVALRAAGARLSLPRAA